VHSVLTVAGGASELAAGPAFLPHAPLRDPGSQGLAPATAGVVLGRRPRFTLEFRGLANGTMNGEPGRPLGKDGSGLARSIRER